MKTATKLFSINTDRYFPHGIALKYLNQNVLIGEGLYRIEQVETYKNKTYLSYQANKEIKEPAFQLKISFPPSAIEKHENGLNVIRLYVINELLGRYDRVIDDSIIFYNHLPLLLSGEYSSMKFYFSDRETGGKLSAKGTVTGNSKNFTSMDKLIAKKAFDYAFKNIDSFEVTKQ